MTILAHITDAHLLEHDHHRRTGLAARRLRFLSFGRPRDALRRRTALSAALVAAHRAGAEHVVFTGDLTEDGTPAQFDVLAAVLATSPFDPRAITLVPGNHDAYDDGEAWKNACDGPLAPYRASSEDIVDVGDAAIVPVSTAMHQAYFRSAGRVSVDAIERTRVAIARLRSPRRATVVAIHHPPIGSGIPFADHLDGLVNHRDVHDLVCGERGVAVLHGHTHRRMDAWAGDARVFGAAAVVDGPESLRLYRVVCGVLEPIDGIGRAGVTPALASAAFA